MKNWLRSHWLWLALLPVGALIGAFLFLQHSVVNVMHPALDKLASIPLSQRWSHPEMLKIRSLGKDAIPPLRSVLREKDNPTTRFLLWVKAKWPGSTKYYSHFPDPNKMMERRWTACQVLQTLGPAGKSAAPEIIQILKTGDIGDCNAASMALWAIGIDADICDRLVEVLESGVASESGKIQIISALASIKPRSVRTLQALTAALADSSSHVQYRAAETLGRLGVAPPAAISALKKLQSTSTNELTVVMTSATLWDLQKDPTQVFAPVLRILKSQPGQPLALPFGGGSGGQGVNAQEQIFMAAADLFRRMDLREPEKSDALTMLDSWCEKSGRIFIRMLLLPPMMDLGFSKEKCLEVCLAGLSQPEDYYRIQAARLLVSVSERYPDNQINLDILIHDPEAGVRVYASKIHWRKNKQARAVVPVLIEILNRTKHQSYYYDIEILPAALDALAEIGPEAQEAATELDKIARDPNLSIAKLASQALVRIRK